jgi:hypothetical protein
VRLTAKQAPHRPGISSALGLRAVGDDFLIVTQTRIGRHAHDQVSNDLSRHFAIGTRDLPDVLACVGSIKRGLAGRLGLE